MEVRIGAMGWSYAGWVGSFLPPGTKSPAYLAEYARRFDTIELDTTFYAIPRAATVRGWHNATPPEFRFTAKLPRAITHDRGLRESDGLLAEFLTALEPLGEKLGPVLTQLPPSFQATPDNVAAVTDFLRLLPGDIPFAVEFRHRSWQSNAARALLRERGVAWTITELPYLPRLVETTSDITYVRLQGDRSIQTVDRVLTDRTRDLQVWAAVLQGLASRLRQAWVFINNQYSGHAPENIRQLRMLLGLPPEAGSREPAPEQGRLL